MLKPNFGAILPATAFFCLLLGLAGCDERDPDELRLLTENDPGFQKVLDIQTKRESEIAKLKNELLQEKAEVDEKTRVLKLRFEREMASKGQRIEELKNKMKATRQTFNQKTALLRDQLGIKRRESSDVDHAIKNVRDILAKKGALSIEGEELHEWQNRVEELESRLGPLRADIESLNSEVSLRKKKVKYL